MLKLQEVSYGQDEIKEVIDSLLSGYITMGKKNKQFEKDWNDWLGSKYSVSCNSGSSANLLMISTLKSPLLNYGINDGDNIIVPAASWSTTYFPIIQNNLKCNLVDIDSETLTIDTSKIEEVINERTKAIFAVHLVGNVCQMDKLKEICKKYNLILLEDCCESHGAEWNGQKVGTFGLASSFSFMFAHHISTSEGGMVSCDEVDFSNVLKIQRAHGWIRDIDLNSYELLESNLIGNDIDRRYLFVDTGYNMRMTELQAAFGIHQVKKLNGFIDIRRNNIKIFSEMIIEKNLEEKIRTMCQYPQTNPSPLATPIICTNKKDKENMVKNLEKANIETRPIASGNITRHPFFDNYKDNFIINDNLENANKIHDYGFWIGNNQSICADDYVQVIDIIEKSFKV